jgi:hypothetical protein
MPLFKRRGHEHQVDEPAGTSRVLTQREILDRLEEEIFLAERYGRSLAVLCVLPQLLPAEALDPVELATAADAVNARLRFSDRVGVLDEGTLVLVLPETSGDVARVIGQRIASDLGIRSAAAGHRKWLAGTGTFPEDGADPPTIVVAALQRARG